MVNPSLVSDKCLENQATVGIILAAGMGKRMKTSLPKVAHTILGKPLVIWSIESLLAAGVRSIVTVLSPRQPDVRALVENYRMPAGCQIRVAFQDEALGTAHAVSCGLPTARALLVESLRSTDASFSSPLQVVVGFGDTPAMSGGSFSRYLAFHQKNSNGVTLLAFEPKSQAGYGRVLCNEKGEFLAVREEKDCTPLERLETQCNSGFLCATLEALESILPKVGNANAAKEYYLTDVPRLALEQGLSVGVFQGIEPCELEGVNSQEQLAGMARVLQNRCVREWMAAGVQFLMPDSVYVEPSISFASDVVVEPFVYLSGNQHFDKGTRILAGTRLA